MISLKSFRRKYQHSTSTAALSFNDPYDWRTDFEIDFDVYLPTKGCNLQRGLVWTIEQKQSFITSILKNNPIPSITIVQIRSDRRDGKNTWQVIDGKQRLTTLFAYYDGKFPIVVDGQEYYFNDLPADCQRELKHADIRVVVHYHYEFDETGHITDDVKIQLFEDINWLGTPQDIEHLNNLKSN
jgi:hypothetical protein